MMHRIPRGHATEGCRWTTRSARVALDEFGLPDADPVTMLFGPPDTERSGFGRGRRPRRGRLRRPLSHLRVPQHEASTGEPRRGTSLGRFQGCGLDQ
jgi:hypothetical protein